MNDLINMLAIVLSIVSLIITVVGFFASLKFYRDGVQLQTTANDALVKIEEKTQSIQTQVGGMFDKTLDAAIGKRHELSAGFEDLEKQLSDAKEALLGEVREQIGEAGEQQQLRIKQTVEDQIRLLREKVEATRESAEEIANSPLVQSRGFSRFKLAILNALSSAQSLSSSGLGQYIQKYEPTLNGAYLSRRLRELKEEGFIIQFDENGVRQYQLTPMGRKFLKNT
jgi:predicted transcriptional regulator